MHSPDNSGGITRISERSVSRVVEAATLSVPGSVRVDGGLAGRNYPRFDIEVDDAAGTASVEAFIAVSWPSPVTTVAEAVRATIQDWVRGLTGLRPTAVNVVTGPIVTGERRVTQAVVDAAPRTPEVTPVHTRNKAKISSPKITRNPLRPAEIFSPQVPDEFTLREIHTAPEQPLREVKVRREVPEVPVEVADPQPLRPIRTPRKPMKLAKISYPREHRLQPVRINSTLSGVRSPKIIKKGGRR